MKIELTLQADTAVFLDVERVEDHDDIYINDEDLATGAEVARILRRVASACKATGVDRTSGEEHPLHDANGNVVGHWKATP